jgi:tRNA (adenine37-N6)-methyltransferase
MRDIRPGELLLPFDPSERPDATVMFIGRIRSPWTDRASCPKNVREARERGGGGVVIIDEAFRPGLTGIERASHIILLYWLDRAQRDVIVQLPRHSDRTSGVFSLRSPVRPNPIGLAAARLISVDHHKGELAIDAIDCLDGTPVLDVKPYLHGVDAVPDALV